MPKTIREPRLGPRFQQALAFSFELHWKQVRKGTDVPYVSHLLAVASLVLEHGGGEDEAIAALLHDAAEDQGGECTLAEIEARFGPHVSALVRELSDSIPEQGSEGVEKAAWRQRKEGYLERLATASPSARLISAADKLHNCRSTVADLRRDGACVWKRFNTSKEEHLWFYRAFYQTIAEHGSAPIVEALGEAILDLEQATRPGDLAKAIAIAARAHLLQQDKAGAPYVLHPLRLMLTALGESAKIAAVLHDVVEDCEGWSFERLRQEGFSTNVIDALESLTKRKGEAYEDFVKRACENPIGRRVKLSDLLDNCDLSRICCPTARDYERIARYRRAIAYILSLP